MNESVEPPAGNVSLSGVQLWVLAGAIVDLMKVAEAFGDDSFRRALEADANEALCSIHLPPPPGVTFKLIVNTERLVHIVIPGPPFGPGEPDPLPSLTDASANEYTWGRVGPLVARVWADSQLRSRFFENPRTVLDSEIGAVPECTEVVALQNTRDLVHLVVWSARSTGEHPAA